MVMIDLRDWMERREEKDSYLYLCEFEKPGEKSGIAVNTYMPYRASARASDLSPAMTFRVDPASAVPGCGRENAVMEVARHY
jgi:hypothetical protein